MNFKNIFVCLLLILASITTLAALPAHREAGEGFDKARSRYMQGKQNVMHKGGERSAWNIADSFEKMDFSHVTDVESMEKLNEIFNFIRSTKLMTNLSGPLPNRRLSWFYPDDGCYVRAELASYFVSQQNKPETFKFFGFGNLAVKTHNHPSGIIRWWYHVVPIYRVGNQAYAIDPAIDVRGPMTVEEWKKSMETESPVEKFAVCKPHTIGPEDDCVSPPEENQYLDTLLREQKDFLSYEWSRVKNLGRNPEAELGDSPPW